MSIQKPQSLSLLSKRRKGWQQSAKKQHSFSLDVPQKLYDFNSLSKGLESLFESPLKSREEDRVILYLPRNLSYCEVCSDVIRDHVQKKVRLLSNRLCQLEDLPPTPVDRDQPYIFGKANDDDDDDDGGGGGGLWAKKCCSSVDGSNAAQSPTRSHSILKKRAVSFPAPRKDSKKVVRFADALGLELESIRFLVQKDLQTIVPTLSGQKKSEPGSGETKMQLIPAFLAPSLAMHFRDRLERLKVSLHSVSTADSTVYGIVSVVNLTFHKFVFVRYTVNAWVSHHDEIASYLEGSSDNDSDKFSFTLFCNPSDLYTTGHSLFFAVCYQTAEKETFWDNNDGKNYCIKCEIKEIPKVGSHSWVHFL